MIPAETVKKILFVAIAGIFLSKAFSVPTWFKYDRPDYEYCKHCGSKVYENDEGKYIIPEHEMKTMGWFITELSRVTRISDLEITLLAIILIINSRLWGFYFLIIGGLLNPFSIPISYGYTGGYDSIILSIKQIFLLIGWIISPIQLYKYTRHLFTKEE